MTLQDLLQPEQGRGRGEEDEQGGGHGVCHQPTALRAELGATLRPIIYSVSVDRMSGKGGHVLGAGHRAADRRSLLSRSRHCCEETSTNQVCGMTVHTGHKQQRAMGQGCGVGTARARAVKDRVAGVE